MTAINVASSNAIYSSLDGVLFNKNQTELMLFPQGRIGAYTVPNAVSTIGGLAFFECSGLASIITPGSLSNVDAFAFFFCTNLTAVYAKGNPFASDLSLAFYGSSNVTIYYLPGTSGWGMPAVLWNPQMQANDASFGVRTNRFGFNIVGTINIPVAVEASTSLSDSSWVTLQSGLLTNGSIYFSDPQWTNYPRRYYRLRSP